MEYLEVVPHAALRPFVRCTWSLRGAAGSAPAGEPERVVPDGCAEIVLNGADRFRRLDRTTAGCEPHDQASVLLVGQLERAISIAATGVVDLLGVRFEPGGLFALLGIPMHELTGRDLCLGDVDEPLRRELARAMEAADGGTREGRIERVERVLASRAECARSRAPGLVAAAVARLELGRERAEDLARSLGVSRRSLERAFRREVGLTPKRFARIRRLQGVLAVLDRARPVRSWADLAFARGFADQSHLIREFRDLAGTTPGRYLRERTTLNDLFARGELSQSSNPPPEGVATVGVPTDHGIPS